MSSPLIIIGASTRAAAQSAIRAGYTPHCIDLFADRDLAEIAHVVRCPPNLYPHGIPSILFNPIHEFPEAPVLLTGSMENHLDAVTFISRRLPLMGSSVASIRHARNPFTVNRILVAHPVHGISPVPAYKNFPHDAFHQILQKPFHSSAGHAISLVTADTASADPQYFYQPFIRGTPISALYYSGHLLGATHQIIGAVAFGATRPTQYVGNVAPIKLLPEHQFALASLGRILTTHIGLTGIFGVDFILDDFSTLHPLEINPRYTASLELLELAHGAAYLAFKPGALPEARHSDTGHRRASAVRNLEDSTRSKSRSRPTQAPAVSKTPTSSDSVFHAKAILYAIRESIAPNLFTLFPRSQVADVPPAGELIPTGRPVCTLMTSAQSPSECMSHLHDMATYLYTRL